MCNRLLPEMMKNGDAGIFPVYFSLKIDIELVVDFSGNTPQDSKSPRQSSAALKSRVRGHDSIPVRSPQSSAVSDTQACRKSSSQSRTNDSMKTTVFETVV